MQTFVLYASMNGHTEVLATAVADGARKVEGMDVVLSSVEDIDPDSLKEATAIIWGSSGYFGEPNPKMSNFLSKLGGLWFSGALQGKIGGVFATTSTQHGGVENICRALQTPMQHHGMIFVSNTGPLDDNRVKYGNPYGATAVIPVEESKDAPLNKPVEGEMKIAEDYGRLVAEIATKLSK
ncbi:flavodoxin domain-containing protein [Alteribacter aurantiacus]|uniref:flavodoxin domain-containing protein n=1 Tax=Alteribacter aurantiacus TaxID=254410 RepID=UPI00041111D6|nr:flavodoxin domain-containing protein [Alteribacter aurantiacus]